MVLLNTSRVRGFWVNQMQYRMVDSVTGIVCSVWVPQVALLDPRERMSPEEAEDIILEYHEDFVKRVEKAQPKKPMSRNEQHDLGRVAKEIKASQQHRKESLHGRYW